MHAKLNILYISNLSGNPWAGPTYSVPAQIAAQARIDNVFWYNLSDLSNEKIVGNLQKLGWKDLAFYHDLAEFPHKDIAKLPDPFNKPDLIVLEQFYTYGNFPILLWRIIQSKIPYIIIPRGELTRAAQHSKWLKKLLANRLSFYRFASKAVAIEYLTAQEAEESGSQWNQHKIIVPNGIILPAPKTKTYIAKPYLQFVFLGRLDSYHKGIDLLLQACAKMQWDLRNANFKLDIYGPDRLDERRTLETQSKSLNLQDMISFHDGLYGTKKATVLEHADGFMMTSRFEGHPMGLIEALSYGLPCVVTTGTNMRLEIEKYNAGWTADNTAQSIAAALKKMLAQREQFSPKSQNARKLAEQYDWDKIAIKSHKIYEEILKRQK